MKLCKLLDGIECQTSLDGQIEIAGVTCDSRKVKSGFAFVCLTGEVDGNDFIEEAKKNGCSVVVSEKDLPFPSVRVKSSREAFALMSKNFFGSYCDKMKIVGITGTNGKTTTADITAQILNMSGKSAATIGTLGVSYDGQNEETGFTTPDPDILHQQFEKLYKQGVEYVVMEVSAHAIALQKLAGINFEIGIITNISQDHLDYFKTMDNYAETKLSFFRSGQVKKAIYNLDDMRILKMFDDYDDFKISYSSKNEADVFSFSVKQSFEGSRFYCWYGNRTLQIKTNLIGQHNISNTLAAITACEQLGVKDAQVEQALCFIAPTEGRFNVIDYKGRKIIIDFAHTPQGITSILSAVKELAPHKVISVFGCGGNRDKTKRPQMAAAACAISDKVYITSDNPRFEKPMSIINQVAAGASGDFVKIENRTAAIYAALDASQEGDCIVILGKGAERYQEIKGSKIPYNDFDVVCSYMQSHVRLDEEDE